MSKTYKNKKSHNILKNSNHSKNKSYFTNVERLWSKDQPGTHQRTIMLKKCGKKCFLGPHKSFPICTKNTCKINKKGIQAAYKRAREYMTIKGTKKYKKIADKARRML
jgi:hypothetical protein